MSGSISRREVAERLKFYILPMGGIGVWKNPTENRIVLGRLGKLEENHLTYCELKQLFVLAHEGPISEGFFKYYWMEIPEGHTYDVRLLPKAAPIATNGSTIESLDHLEWGLYRLYVDALLYFGNVKAAFNALRPLSYDELVDFFKSRRFGYGESLARGPSLPLLDIPDDDRYLISETALDAYKSGTLLEKLRQGTTGGSDIRMCGHEYEGLGTVEEIEAKSIIVQSRQSKARDIALINTTYYLSMLGEMDAYIATSMREPKHFKEVARLCKAVFFGLGDIRYFDPTISVAKNPEDKGLIECLMVKCSKLLIYIAGDSDSYGKDAEAAMALSLGKPVIFYCPDESKAEFYRSRHPLARLIDFRTGVAVGAMVASNEDQVRQLVKRILNNEMQYSLARDEQSGCLRLKELLTESVVRLQTDDELLTETFWNHYHQNDGRLKRA